MSTSEEPNNNNHHTPSLSLSLSLSTNQQQQQQQNTHNLIQTDPTLPITPEALLRHVRQMRIAAINRRRSPSTPVDQASLSVHSRAGSNASSNYDEVIGSNLCLSSSTMSTCSNDGHSNTNNQSLTLTIPDSSRIENNRAMAETLDLSHRRIADLTQPVVEELAEYVERLALGYNYLPVLPDHFAILGDSLRYLNLRGNHMEIFPEVLTRMPSLEILDVSRNKIKAFPRRPGSLDRLRVLSVSRNRIKRLPNYVANLTTLRVLKIDHNPVIWPPKELVTFVDACERADEDEVDPTHRARDDGSSHIRTRTPSSETSTSMAQWLRTLQEWMRKNPYVRPVKQIRPSTGEIVGDPSEFGALRSAVDFERSFHNFKGTQSPDISPVMTLSSGGPGTSPVTTSVPISRTTTEAYDHMVQHNRNASSSSSSQWVRKRPELRLKKSLPDLRRNHAEIMVERSADVERAYFGLNRSTPILPPSSSSSVTFSLNSPNLADRGPRSAMALSSGTSTPGLATNNPPPSTSQVSFNESDLVRPGASQIRRIKIGTSAEDDSLAGDRNSGAYFRRLSMLPASTISKQVPTPLLQLMDGIRGILFSLSQIYAALKQFVMFATQDRLPGALSRMTSAADDSMGKLINSLDRFDSSTRRAQPELEVVQQVFKSCRDNVIVFGKLVNVLSIQLKVLTASADVRYSRTLLLSLYGATAEIAMSWQMITPLVDDVISLPSLRKSKPTSPPPPAAPLHESKEESSSSNDFQKTTANISASELRRTVSRENLTTDQSSLPESSKTIASTSSNNLISPANTSTQTNKGRRQGGSYVAEDVQIGGYISPATPAGLTALPLPSYGSVSPSPSPSSEGFGSASKTEGSQVMLNEESRPSPSSRHPFPRQTLDPLSIGPSALDSSSKSSLLDTYPSLISPGTISLPRSPALTSIASLSSTNTTTNTVPYSVEPSSILNENEHVASSRPTLPLFSNSNKTIIDIPERTTSKFHPHSHSHPPPPHSHPHHSHHSHHSRFDNSLSRTDQDFLDMTDATIDIALSVTSLMLENLRQPGLDLHHHHSIPNNTHNNDTSINHRPQNSFDEPNGGAKNEVTSSSSGTPITASSSSTTTGTGTVTGRRERKGTVGLSKPAELKELCEQEIEVIRRLRTSLAGFWAHRNSLSHSSCSCSHHPHQQQQQQHQQSSHSHSNSQSIKESSSSSSSSSSTSLTSLASSSNQSNHSNGSYGSAFSTSTTTPDLHLSNNSNHSNSSPFISSSSSSSSSSSLFLNPSSSSASSCHFHYPLDLNSSCSAIGSVESRKVFEDATAFVRAVIQTANLARLTMIEYPLSKSIREGLGELTKATKELATLLAVSSFKPGGNGSNIGTGTGTSVGPGTGNIGSSSTTGSLSHPAGASTSTAMPSTYGSNNPGLPVPSTPTTAVGFNSHQPTSAPPSFNPALAVNPNSISNLGAPSLAASHASSNANGNANTNPSHLPLVSSPEGYQYH
ncbi:RAM signaling network component [Puccinia graminis f. sp. tritici]|uniref:RAM signaling network component n=2 Tax=Puccinia graminis f. sp. tritici TaxID=56615 RepID=A0A5B0P1K1_PUCGR|nr:RAM signaling network component [Puccinia graminis f. sp. tritici]